MGHTVVLPFCILSLTATEDCLQLLASCTFNTVFFLASSEISNVAFEWFHETWVQVFTLLLYGINAFVDPMMYVVSSSQLQTTLWEMLELNKAAAWLKGGSGQVNPDFSSYNSQVRNVNVKPAVTPMVCVK